MLIALMTILFLGGSVQDAVLDYIKETKAVVKEVVEDKSRLSEVNETLADMKKRSKERNKSAKQVLKQLQGEMSAHDVNETNIDSIFDDYLQTLIDYNTNMVDLRFQLKDQVSREEWDALFGQRT